MTDEQQRALDATMCYAGRVPGWPGYCAVMIDPGEHASKDERKWVAKDMADWIKSGYIIEHVTRGESVAGMKEYLDERKRRDALPKPAPEADLPLFNNA